MAKTKYRERQGGAGRRLTPRRRWWQVGWVVPAAALIVAAAVLVFVFVGRRQSQGTVTLPSGAQLATIIDEVTHINPHVFDSVGTGGLANPLKPGDTSQRLTGPSGKPEVLYIGAEYCPYCASERWSLIAALSRFGQFEDLHINASTANDVYPNTPTFSFYQSQYSSSSIDFVPVETETRDEQPLQSLDAAQQALLNRFDQAGSIPFLDIGNRYIAVGSGYDTGLLGGLNWQEIAGALNDPNTPTTKAILGNANFLTAAICQTTNGQPGSVCTSTGVATAAKQLAGGSS